MAEAVDASKPSGSEKMDNICDPEAQEFNRLLPEAEAVTNVVKLLQMGIRQSLSAVLRLFYLTIRLLRRQLKEKPVSRTEEFGHGVQTRSYPAEVSGIFTV